uniref:Uncharacterized protein n=1 Tax=Toxoplasma gondii (strain ATCC 50861 / VEG) TaxID=432359 RepID=A0A0F7V6Y9_TOXGV|nr:TPA: hypothetical protein BN1205_066885 [Toxoplasma gondii VEG]
MITTVLAVSAAAVAIKKKFRRSEDATSLPVFCGEPVISRPQSLLADSRSGDIATSPVAHPRYSQEIAYAYELNGETLTRLNSDELDAWGYLSCSVPRSNCRPQRENAYPPLRHRHPTRRVSASQQSVSEHGAVCEVEQGSDARTRGTHLEKTGSTGDTGEKRNKLVRSTGQELPVSLLTDIRVPAHRLHPVGRCVQKHFDRSELREEREDRRYTRSRTNLGSLM